MKNMLFLLFCIISTASGLNFDTDDDINDHTYLDFKEYFDGLPMTDKRFLALPMLKKFLNQDNRYESHACVKTVLSTIIEVIYADVGFHNFLPQAEARRAVFAYLASLDDSDLNIEEVLHTQNINLPVDGQANRLLHKAAAEEVPSPSYIHVLINAGADLNVANNDGITPLHWAITLLDTHKTAFLFENGANLEIPNNSGLTALHMLCINHVKAREDMMQLPPERRGNSMYGNASDHESMGREYSYRMFIIGKFLSRNAPMNTQDFVHGKVPLHYAIANGFSHIVEMLVAAHADVNVKSFLEETPFDMALKMDQHLSFVFLMEGQYNLETVEQLKTICEDDTYMLTDECKIHLQTMEARLEGNN